jgi:hypothetical protein
MLRLGGRHNISTRIQRVLGNIHEQLRLPMPLLHGRVPHVFVRAHVVVQRRLPERVRIQWLQLRYVLCRYLHALLVPHGIAVPRLSEGSLLSNGIQNSAPMVRFIFF